MRVCDVLGAGMLCMLLLVQIVVVWPCEIAVVCGNGMYVLGVRGVLVLRRWVCGGRGWLGALDQV